MTGVGDDGRRFCTVFGTGSGFRRLMFRNGIFETHRPSGTECITTPIAAEADALMAYDDVGSRSFLRDSKPLDEDALSGTWPGEHFPVFDRQGNSITWRRCDCAATLITA